MEKERNTTEKVISIIIGILYAGVAIAWIYAGIRWIQADFSFMLYEKRWGHSSIVKISDLVIPLIPAFIYLIWSIVGIFGEIKKKHWVINGVIGLVWNIFWVVYQYVGYMPGLEFLSPPSVVGTMFLGYYYVSGKTILIEVVIIVLLKIINSLKKKRA